MKTPSVYTGQWTDHSRGPVLGYSLTVEARYGAYIISGTAAFITLVGGIVWTIIAYILHQSMVPKEEASLILRQQQVILLNSQSALATAWQLFRVAWTWSTRDCLCCRRRRTKPRPAHRRTVVSLSLAMVPFLSWSVFVALGIFSAKLAQPVNKESAVLVKSGNCGLWTFNGTGQLGFQEKVLRETNAGRIYARSCYSRDLASTSNTPCTSYAVAKLDYYSLRQEQQCPFGNAGLSPGAMNSTGFSRSPCNATQNTGAHLMETVELDSHTHLGMNAVESNRLRFKKSAVCSPIAWQGRYTTGTGPVCTSSSINETACPIFQFYNFGSLGNDSYTYFYDPATVRQGVGYAIAPFIARSGRPTAWVPLPELQREDGDLSLFLLMANAVEYRTQILDPWFLARYKTSGDKFYQPSNVVSPLACVDQFSFRNPTNNRSTTPSGIQGLLEQVKQLDLNDAQTVVAQRLLFYLSNSDTYSSVYSTGSNALKASDKVLTLISSGVPSDQWRTEVQGWFETGLSKLQAAAVEYADVTDDLGPGGNVTFGDFADIPSSAWQDQCENQKINNVGQYQTFSLFGLILTYVLGIIIIIVGLALQPLISCIVRRKGDLADSPRELSLVADNKLQLHRMVLDQGDEYQWEGLDGDYPWCSTDIAIRNPVLEGKKGVMY